MNTGKLTIDKLIEALELHLSPRTDPDHCDPCPYNDPDAVGDGALDVPQSICVYKLMHDCLDTLKKVVQQEEEMLWIKDFIEYTLNSDIPVKLLDTDTSNAFTENKFAFMLGAAFERYKRIWED